MIKNVTDTVEDGVLTHRTLAFKSEGDGRTLLRVNHNVAAALVQIEIGGFASVGLGISDALELANALLDIGTKPTPTVADVVAGATQGVS